MSIEQVPARVMKVDRWMTVPLVVGVILAYGAALTSQGLRLATWVPRLSRAVALTVTADILATVSWFFAMMIAAQALEPETTVGLS